MGNLSLIKVFFLTLIKQWRLLKVSVIHVCMCGSYCLLAFTGPLIAKSYIRPIYKEFLEIIFSYRIRVLQQRAHTRFGLGIRITGTPRIGKSTFLFYVAEKLKQEKICLVITIEKITYTDDFRRIEFHKAEEILKDTETVHLIDGATAFGQHNALAIFFCITN